MQRTYKHVQANLEALFGLKNTPSDTQMRERLDEIDSSQLRFAFKKVFSMLQRHKILEAYTFLRDYYLVSVDGTGHFSSSTVHCKNCCIKNHKNGDISYYHQILGASLVHPDKKQVITLAPEPILKQDGNNKAWC